MIKLSSAQAIALREASMGEHHYAVSTAKGQTVKAMERMGLVVPGSRLLTNRGVVAMNGVRAHEGSIAKGVSVIGCDLGDAEELFWIPAPTQVESDVRADWEREESSNVVIDEPYWAFNGPILAQLDYVPRECYYACGEAVTAVWFDIVGNVEGACAAHVIEINANGYHSTNLPVEIMVQEMPSTPDLSAVPAECYYGCSNPVTHAFTDYVGRTEGVCGAHAHLPLSGKVVALPTDDMIEEEAQTAKPYVVEGRVWVKIPGLFHNGQPVEVDEGTERFIITPGYSTELDCAHMTCIKRYGRRNPNVRVSDVTYVGPLNP